MAVDAMRDDADRTLARDAVADVWRHTLAGIPSIFGRLMYLASLRNANTGRYEHHGLAMVFNKDQAHGALLESHQQSFAQWLNSPLPAQKADIELYLSDLPERSRDVIQSWLKLPPYTAVAPATARESEKELLARDFEALLEALRREYAVEPPEPEE